MNGPELVLGVPRARLWTGGGWRGVRTEGVDVLLVAALRSATYRPRSEAEDDSSWKQLIPYLLLRDAGRLFVMRRTQAGGDVRLHDRISLGVGGHVNPGDESIEGALLREWREEIEADFVPPFRLVGLLNDDTDPVGAVHLGIVFEADAAGRPVTIRETATAAAALRGRMETWSVLLLDHVLGTGAARAK